MSRENPEYPQTNEEVKVKNTEHSGRDFTIFHHDLLPIPPFSIRPCARFSELGISNVLPYMPFIQLTTMPSAVLLSVLWRRVWRGSPKNLTSVNEVEI